MERTVCNGCKEQCLVACGEWCDTTSGEQFYCWECLDPVEDCGEDDAERDDPLAYKDEV